MHLQHTTCGSRCWLSHTLPSNIGKPTVSWVLALDLERRLPAAAHLKGAFSLLLAELECTCRTPHEAVAVGCYQCESAR